MLGLGVRTKNVEARAKEVQQRVQVRDWEVQAGRCVRLVAQGLRAKDAMEAEVGVVDAKQVGVGVEPWWSASSLEEQLPKVLLKTNDAGVHLLRVLVEHGVLQGEPWQLQGHHATAQTATQTRHCSEYLPDSPPSCPTAQTSSSILDQCFAPKSSKGEVVNIGKSRIRQKRQGDMLTLKPLLGSQPM